MNWTWEILETDPLELWSHILAPEHGQALPAVHRAAKFRKGQISRESQVNRQMDKTDKLQPGECGQRIRRVGRQTTELRLWKCAAYGGNGPSHH